MLRSSLQGQCLQLKGRSWLRIGQVTSPLPHLPPLSTSYRVISLKRNAIKESVQLFCTGTPAGKWNSPETSRKGCLLSTCEECCVCVCVSISLKKSIQLLLSLPPQDEKNQLMTTNVWLKQVKYIQNNVLF